jgi:tripartite-type tricarboxylate transporter receptor subunit TctC
MTAISGREKSLHATLTRTAPAVLVAAAFALSASTAAAQAFPTKPIRMIVPFSPGGSVDVPGRIIARKLADALGQQVIVDPRPGAGSTIGTEAVARAPADGYTLLLTAPAFVISAGLYKKLPYDPLTDFAAVGLVGSAPCVLVVHPSLPAKNVKQLVALARAQPGKINFGSSGNGTSPHLFGMLFMQMTNTVMTHIPYRGSGPSTTDLISGEVSVGFPGIATALPHIKLGRLRSLAVTSAQRSPQMPDVPTIAESGVPGYDAALWLGIVVPQGTPKAVIDKLNNEINNVLQLTEVKDGYMSIGFSAVGSTPEAFAAYIKSEYAKWVKIVRESAAKAN